MDRKHYSRRRECLIRDEISKAITDLRIYILREHLDGSSAKGKESLVFDQLKNLPDKITEIYRMKLNPSLKELLESISTYDLKETTK